MIPAAATAVGAAPVEEVVAAPPAGALVVAAPSPEPPVDEAADPED